MHGALSFGCYRDGQRAIYTRRAPDGSGLIELRAAHLETGEDVLLRAGSIAEVAVTVGFADQSHMAKHFKRLLGVTPSRYRAGGADARMVA